MTARQTPPGFSRRPGGPRSGPLPFVDAGVDGGDSLLRRPNVGGQPSIPLDGLLTQLFDRLSRQVAGGTRTDPRDLLPGAADPMEGVIPEEFLPEVNVIDWFNPTLWARAAPGEMSLIDLSNITAATGPGKEGKGLDWFRGGEAPNNYANRHNPLYQARRDFAEKITPEIEKLFGVSAQGSAGHMRQPQASHAAPGGPSSNSDHYSGGALDLFGSKEEMTALRNWAVEQPWVSFVRFQSESHFDHVHLSIDLGWVAQNFFEGRNVPPVKPSSPVSASTSPQRTTEEATRSLTGGGVQVT